MAETTDIIVNAANSQLGHGGGLARAISVAGGPIVNSDSKEFISTYGEVRTGETCYTSSGKLKAKYLLHTVGPRWYDFSDADRSEERRVGKEC